MLAVVIAAIAIFIFVGGGVVAWPQAMVMIPGGALGGYAGVWLAKRVPQNAVRALRHRDGIFLAVVLLPVISRRAEPDARVRPPLGGQLLRLRSRRHFSILP